MPKYPLLHLCFFSFTVLCLKMCPPDQPFLFYFYGYFFTIFYHRLPKRGARWKQQKRKRKLERVILCKLLTTQHQSWLKQKGLLKSLSRKTEARKRVLGIRCRTLVTHTPRETHNTHTHTYTRMRSLAPSNKPERRRRTLLLYILLFSTFLFFFLIKKVEILQTQRVNDVAIYALTARARDRDGEGDRGDAQP